MLKIQLFFRLLDVRKISIDKTSPKTSRDDVCKMNEGPLKISLIKSIKYLLLYLKSMEDSAFLCFECGTDFG